MQRTGMIETLSLFVVVATLGLTTGRALHAQTTVPITGIGTSIPGTSAIDTRVEHVTYADPIEVMIDGMCAVEIRGTVSGVGWGGSGIVPRSGGAHYRYEIPFVARWRKVSPGNRLVFYNHGGGLSLMTAVKRDKLSGAANPNRFTERNGDLLVGVPALLNCATYISINRRGLREDGTFCATYLAPVPPLTAAEVAGIEAELASAPPVGAGFMQPGIVAGAPVPVLPTNDAPTCRDIARALEQVVANLQGRPFRTRIGVGISSGARLLAALNFGRSAVGAQSVRTGGNHVNPYDSGSARLFDAYLLNGFTYVAGVEQADAALPLSAPTMFVQGQADERYQQHVTMAHELLQKGVRLRDQVWIYEIGHLPHVTRESLDDPTLPTDGDRLGCFMSACIRNLFAHLEEGRSPPLSRMAGRIVDGALRFEQAGGQTTNVVPIPDDPALDSIVVDGMLTPRTIDAADTARWLSVRPALPHVNAAIRPPSLACRLGGYKLRFFGSELVPFTPAELTSRYGCFERYRDCVRHSVSCLESQRLYDARVESACSTAERARALFVTASRGPNALRDNRY